MMQKTEEGNQECVCPEQEGYKEVPTGRRSSDRSAAQHPPSMVRMPATAMNTRSHRECLSERDESEKSCRENKKPKKPSEAENESPQ